VSATGQPGNVMRASERDGDGQKYTLPSDADDAVFRGSAREVEGLFTPPPWSSSAAKMLGESNLGAANQSTTPCDDTSAAVSRSPTRPCSAMGG
jgi:hypothetical protein